MKAFFARWASTTFAVFVATGLLHDGIKTDSFEALVWAGLLLGILNAIVRPVLLVLSLPLIVLSLGFFILLINAFLLSVVGWLIPGFRVDGFGWAVLGAIVISFVSWALNNVLQNRARLKVHVNSYPPEAPPNLGQMKNVKGRVIEDESDPK